MTMSSPRCEERESRKSRGTRSAARFSARARGPAADRGERADEPALSAPSRSERAEHQEYYVNERNSSHRGTKSIARTPRGRSDRMLSLSPNSR